VQDTLDQDEQLAQPRRNRAWRIHEFGGPEVLRREQVPVPSASPGQVVVEVKAVGINQLDWKFWEGRVGGLPVRLPATLGVEFAGVITAVGDRVTSFQPGDRVMAHLYELGAYADFVAVAAQDLARIPVRLSDRGRGAADVGVDCGTGIALTWWAPAGYDRSDPRRGGSGGRVRSAAG
jgi:NADPH:quinone reductase-like Zn-dependent oxidoreductase